jgi:molecular chaperone HtpG
MNLKLKSVEELYKKVLQDSMNKVEIKPLSSDENPIVIVKPEFMRRMTEMQMLQGNGMGKLPEMYTVVVNSNHPLISNKLLKLEDDVEKEKLAKYLYDLARLSQQMLTGAELTAFIHNNLEQLK